ncbi:MAG: rane protein [Acidobacteriota bacterium]|jgi:membrane protein|nr:rane protein [Acidobacteriota bacterium]
MNPKSGLGLLKETFKEWQDDDALQLGASLSYYTIFSLAPMLLVVIAIAGMVYGREAVQGQLVGQLRGLVGEQGGEAIQTMVANAGRHGSGVLATVIGVVTILFGATGLFVALQDSLNRIWEVEAKPGQGLKGFIMNRVISFGMILGVGFLLLVSLVLSAAMAAVGTWATGLMPGAEILVKILTFVVSFGVEMLLFAMIFKVLPDVKIAWRDVWIGAAATALLFTLGKLVIGLYIAHSSVASAFGAAGSVVILLLWVYYSSQILFLGAEFTQVYASHYGSRIVPDEHAVPVVVEKREAKDAKEWPPASRKGKENEKGAPERPQGTSQDTSRDNGRRTGS